MRLEGSSVVVTGGAGFIGSHLVDRLAAHGVRRIVVVDTLWLGREENLAEARRAGADVELLRVDAADFPAMKGVIAREPFDVIFNLATRPLNYSFEHPRDAYMTSVDIAANLAELLRAGAFGRLVQYSTSEIYGDAVETPMSEQHPTRPTTPYAAGKLAADVLLRSYVEVFGIPVLTIRPFNNYGPRQNDGDYAAVIPTTIRRILAGQPPYLEGTGEQTRDFTYVRDTAALTVTLAESDPAWGQTLNVACACEVRIAELIETICRLMGYEGPIERRPARSGDHRRHLADTSRARTFVRFDALTSLEAGLAETVEWYRRREATAPRRREGEGRLTR
jgi:UDP-glucose 4-epimerase